MYPWVPVNCIFFMGKIENGTKHRSFNNSIIFESTHIVYGYRTANNRSPFPVVSYIQYIREIYKQGSTD